MNNQLTLGYLIKLKCLRLLDGKRAKTTSFKKINLPEFNRRRLTPAGSGQFKNNERVKSRERFVDKAQQKGG